MSTYFERMKLIKLGKLPKEAVAKEKKPLNKIGAKKKAELEEKKLSGDSALDLFFASQRKKLTGRCLFCGAKTMKDDDEKYHFSIAHLLPKSQFKSVATHEDNWIELCFWGNNCHGNLDSGMITWEYVFDSKEVEVIKEKLMNVLPMVAMPERKNKLYTKLCELVYDIKTNQNKGI